MSEMYEINEKTRESQNDDVLHCLKTLGYITEQIAREQYGVYRLSARIYDLRSKGNVIETVPIKFVNRHGHKGQIAKYFLKKAV